MSRDDEESDRHRPPWRYSLLDRAASPVGSPLSPPARAPYGGRELGEAYFGDRARRATLAENSSHSPLAMNMSNPYARLPPRYSRGYVRENYHEDGTRLYRLMHPHRPSGGRPDDFREHIRAANERLELASSSWPSVAPYGFGRQHPQSNLTGSSSYYREWLARTEGLERRHISDALGYERQIRLDANGSPYDMRASRAPSFFETALLGRTASDSTPRATAGGAPHRRQSLSPPPSVSRSPSTTSGSKSRKKRRQPDCIPMEEEDITTNGRSKARKSQAEEGDAPLVAKRLQARREANRLAVQRHRQRKREERNMTPSTLETLKQQIGTAQGQADELMKETASVRWKEREELNVLRQLREQTTACCENAMQQVSAAEQQQSRAQATQEELPA